MPSTTLPAAATGLPADPIFAAIERHRGAQAGWAALGTGYTDEQVNAVSDDESEARRALHATAPQTVAGLAAYVAYWAEYVRRENAGQDDPLMHDHVTPGEPFPAIAQAMAALFPAA